MADEDPEITPERLAELEAEGRIVAVVVRMPNRHIVVKLRTREETGEVTHDS